MVAVKNILAKLNHDPANASLSIPICPVFLTGDYYDHDYFYWLSNQGVYAEGVQLLFDNNCYFIHLASGGKPYLTIWGGVPPVSSCPSDQDSEDCHKYLLEIIKNRKFEQLAAYKLEVRHVDAKHSVKYDAETQEFFEDHPDLLR